MTMMLDEAKEKERPQREKAYERRPNFTQKPPKDKRRDRDDRVALSLLLSLQWEDRSHISRIGFTRGSKRDKRDVFSL